jgi:hypothetical protein
MATAMAVTAAAAEAVMWAGPAFVQRSGTPHSAAAKLLQILTLFPLRLQVLRHDDKTTATLQL